LLADENTLILALPGSGKTLAVFLCAIDSVIRAERSSEEHVVGAHTLYLSPLKALARGLQGKAPILLNGMDPAKCLRRLAPDLAP
jgi:ATP-dependent Lhr-like helicase